MRHRGVRGEGARAPGVRRRLASVFCAAAPVLALFSSSPARAEASASCGSIAFDASVAGQRGLIGGTLCVPPGARTVQVLLHGFTYGQYYWDFPLEPERYSYVQAANATGYATLAIDRLGTVGSLQPLSLLVTVENNASVVHQLVAALRAGELGVAFENVLLVGHSFGSIVAYVEADRYRDVDAIVATGASHQVNLANVSTRVLLGTLPAAFDPKFASLGLDLGYVTTQPGRRQIFYELEDADPAVIALDEELKQTAAAGEVLSFLHQVMFDGPSDVELPVLTVNGSREPLFCNGPLAADCSSSEALAAGERRFFGPDASVDAIVVPGAGHNLSLELSAPGTHSAILEWVDSHGF